MNRDFLIQIELIINNNLYKKNLIDEEIFLKVEDYLILKLKTIM